MGLQECRVLAERSMDQTSKANHQKHEPLHVLEMPKNDGQVDFYRGLNTILVVPH